MNRENNQPDQSSKEHSRRSLFILLRRSVTTDFEERFSPDVPVLFQSGLFLPKTSCSGVDLAAVRETVKTRGYNV